VLNEGSLVWDGPAGDVDWTETSALPRALSGWFSEVPLWVDLRRLRTPAELSLGNPLFLDAVATLAAPLHGEAKDALVGEDVRLHRRASRLTSSSAIRAGPRGGQPALVAPWPICRGSNGIYGLPHVVAGSPDGR
jgi:hypothetical protein